jgi:hypothetical protein
MTGVSLVKDTGPNVIAQGMQSSPAFTRKNITAAFGLTWFLPDTSSLLKRLT